MTLTFSAVDVEALIQFLCIAEEALLDLRKGMTQTRQSATLAARMRRYAGRCATLSDQLEQQYIAQQSQDK